MSDRNAHSLIIKSLSIIEDVHREYREKVGPDIYEEIDKVIKEFIESSDWTGEANFWEKASFWVAPSYWKADDIEDSDEFVAWYCFDFVNDSKSTLSSSSEGYIFHLSPLLGIGATQAGLSFTVNRKYIGSPKASDWKKFGQSHRHYTELSKIGFIQLNSGNWFIPFKLDSDLLADAYVTGTIVDALQPIVDVLQKIKDSHTLFEQVLADSKENFNCSRG